MAILDIFNRRSRLDRQFDELRRREEAGELHSVSRSRVVRKFLNNRLAVLGLVVFSIILLASIFAPLLTPWDPSKVNLRALITGLAPTRLDAMSLRVFCTAGASRSWWVWAVPWSLPPSVF